MALNHITIRHVTHNIVPASWGTTFIGGSHPGEILVGTNWYGSHNDGPSYYTGQKEEASTIIGGRGPSVKNKFSQCPGTTKIWQ